MRIRRIPLTRGERPQPVPKVDVGAPEKIRRIRLAGLLIAAVVVSCGGGQDDLDAWLEEIGARPGRSPEALPRISHPEEFRYAAAGRRSPFAPIGPDTGDPSRTGADPGPDLAREREFLEHYSLDALRMVGSLRHASGLYGLMQTPDGLVHRLATGDYLGRNHGRVTHISAAEVHLVELVADGNGGYLQRPAAISLAD